MCQDPAEAVISNSCGQLEITFDRNPWIFLLADIILWKLHSGNPWGPSVDLKFLSFEVVRNVFFNQSQLLKSHALRTRCLKS